LQENLAGGFWGNGMRLALAGKAGVAKLHLDLRRGDGPPGARHYNFAALTVTDKLIAQEPEVAAAAVRAIMVGTFVTGWRLGQASLRPFWRRVEELGLLVLLHPFFVAPKPGMERHYLTNLVGNPLETTLAMADLVLSGLLDECPRLRFLLAHGGGFAPYQFGRWQHGHRVREEVRIDSPTDPARHLDAFYYDTITHSAAALEFLVRWAGPERVLLGTDLPFDMADHDPVATVDSVRLTAAERRAVLAGNALSLLSAD